MKTKSTKSTKSSKTSKSIKSSKMPSKMSSSIKSVKTANKKSGKAVGRPKGSKNKKPAQVKAGGAVSIMDEMVSISAPSDPRPDTMIEKSSNRKMN